jgi:hypothetical protein
MFKHPGLTRERSAATLRHILISALALLAGLAPLRAGAAQGDPPRPPAPTLKPPVSSTKAPDREGFMQRWILLEPIRCSGQLTDGAIQATVHTDYFPNQYSVLPHDGDKVKVAGNELTWHAVDTINYNVNLYHFAYALYRPTSDVLFWAVTIVNCPREMRGVRLAVGCNASAVCWVNGEEVIGIYGDRQTVIDDGVSKRLTLKKGPNIVRCAIVNGGGATDFCARFLDANDKPVTGITLSLPGPGD